MCVIFFIFMTKRPLLFQYEFVEHVAVGITIKSTTTRFPDVYTAMMIIITVKKKFDLLGVGRLFIYFYCFFRGHAAVSHTGRARAPAAEIAQEPVGFWAARTLYSSYVDFILLNSRTLYRVSRVRVYDVFNKYDHIYIHTHTPTP